MKPKVLITGGSGLLALNWVIAMQSHFEFILGVHKRSVTFPNVTTCNINLSSVNDIVSAVKQWKPDIVIHTVGLTSIEMCESNKELAYHVNVELAENIAKSCSITRTPLVHISTDHLFSGNVKYATENTPVSPVNVYARTKAEAELRVLDAFPEALIARTNFYGWGPSYRNSFSDTIIKALRAGQSIALFQDVYYTPILANELAFSTHELVASNASGIFNIVGMERLSKYDFGLKLAEVFGLNSDLILPAVFAMKPSLVQRPLDMSLSSEKTCNVLGRSLGGVMKHLQLLKAQEKLMQINY